MSIKLSPSLARMDLLNIEKQIKILNKYSFSYHIDLYDGVYVKQFGLTPPIMKEIRKITDCLLDAHVYFNDPFYYLDLLIECGADYISIHTDKLVNEAYRTADYLHDKGKKFGVVIAPETSIETIMPYIDVIDKITVMTIYPGYAGARYIPQTLQKIIDLKKLREKNNYHYLIDFDGASDPEHIKYFKEAGTDLYIIGKSGLFALDPDLDTAAKLCIEYIEKA